MANRGEISLHEIYGGHIPLVIQSQGGLLAGLLKKYCRHAYNESGVRIAIYIRVEGRVGVPFRRTGIKTEPFAKDLLCANVYITKAEWEASLSSYRNFLWSNVEGAIWICVDKLEQRMIRLDREAIARYLSLVHLDFFGPKGIHGQMYQGLYNPVLPILENREDNDQRVVIQYRRDDRNDHWDFEKTVAFENLLNDALQNSGMGFCDSVEFERGTITAICFVSSASRATKIVIETLRAGGLLDGAVIEETIEDVGRVVWPTGYVGTIDYM